LLIEIVSRLTVGQIKSGQKAIISIIGVARRAQWVQTKQLCVIYEKIVNVPPAHQVQPLNKARVNF